jgi:hypothetical protein
MSSQSEIEHLDNEGLRDSLPPSKWVCEIELGENPEERWKRIAAVVRNIVKFDYDDWPDDDYWKLNLPEWLSSFMLTSPECSALMAQTPREQWPDLPWEFGSWLDAIREREWRWWGCKRSESRVQIVLEVTDIPPRIEAFKQILLASGAQILFEEFD